MINLVQSILIFVLALLLLRNVIDINKLKKEIKELKENFKL